MYIFLPRISSSTSEDQLKRFASSILNKKFHIPFMKYPRLLSAEVLEIRDQAGSREYHGLLCIQPDNAAQWFIKSADRNVLNNKAVRVRQYMTRTDDRAGDSGDERRRRNLIISKVVQTRSKLEKQALDNFHQGYGS